MTQLILGQSAGIGPSEKDMVCGFCYRFFQAVESSWKSAEKKPCPYCGSKETSPMLAVYHGSSPILVRDGKGGFI